MAKISFVIVLCIIAISSLTQAQCPNNCFCASGNTCSSCDAGFQFMAAGPSCQQCNAN